MAIITVDSDEYGEATHYGFVEGVDEIVLQPYQYQRDWPPSLQDFFYTAAIAFDSRYSYGKVGDPRECVFIHPETAMDLEAAGLLSLVCQPNTDSSKPIKFDGYVIWLYTINR